MGESTFFWVSDYVAPMAESLLSTAAANASDVPHAVDVAAQRGGRAIDSHRRERVDGGDDSLAALLVRQPRGAVFGCGDSFGTANELERGTRDKTRWPGGRNEG